MQCNVGISFGFEFEVRFQSAALCIYIKSFVGEAIRQEVYGKTLSRLVMRDERCFIAVTQPMPKTLIVG